MHGENDNVALCPEGKSLPSKATLFLPVAVVTVGYAVLLAWLWLGGNLGSNIARLCVIVLAVGVPILIVHAVLRYFTIAIHPHAHAMFIHPGFPRSEPFEIPYPLVRQINIRRGIAGRLLNSGTLIFHLQTGQKIAVCDLQNPDKVRDAIENLIDAGEIMAPQTVEPATEIRAIASEG